SSEPCERTRSGTKAGGGGNGVLPGQRGGAEHEAVLVLLEPALEVKRATRDQHAVPVGGAHAVEGAVERRAPPGLRLLEQRALLAAAARERGEREPEAVQRDAPRELALEQLERARQHHRIGIRGRGERARARRALAVRVAQVHLDGARLEAQVARG